MSRLTWDNVLALLALDVTGSGKSTREIAERLGADQRLVVPLMRIMYEAGAVERAFTNTGNLYALPSDQRLARALEIAAEAEKAARAVKRAGDVLGFAASQRVRDGTWPWT